LTIMRQALSPLVDGVSMPGSALSDLRCRFKI